MTQLTVTDAGFNMREIVKQMILLEQHLTDQRKQCPDCICKHLLCIEALAEEAVALNPTGPHAKQAARLADAARGWLVALKDDKANLPAVAQQVRAVRKAFMQQVADPRSQDAAQGFGARLTAAQRRALPGDDFALPGRRYPINDRGHAMAARARASQQYRAGNLSREGLRRVWAATAKRYGMPHGTLPTALGMGFPGVDATSTAAVQNAVQALQTAPQTPPTEAQKQNAVKALYALGDAGRALQGAAAQIGTVPAGTAQGVRYRLRRMVQAYRSLAQAFFAGATHTYQQILPQLPRVPTGRISPLSGIAGVVASTNAGPVTLNDRTAHAAPAVLRAVGAIIQAAGSMQGRAFTWETRRQGLPQLPGQEIMQQLRSHDLVPSGGGFVWGGIGNDLTHAPPPVRRRPRALPPGQRRPPVIDVPAEDIEVVEVTDVDDVPEFVPRRPAHAPAPWLTPRPGPVPGKPAVRVTPVPDYIPAPGGSPTNAARQAAGWGSGTCWIHNGGQ